MTNPCLRCDNCDVEECPPKVLIDRADLEFLFQNTQENIGYFPESIDFQKLEEIKRKYQKEK